MATFYDFMTNEEKEQLRRLERTIDQAETLTEIKLAKQCIGYLMLLVMERSEKSTEKNEA
jgi:hypothetical protein